MFSLRLSRAFGRKKPSMPRTSASDPHKRDAPLDQQLPDTPTTDGSNQAHAASTPLIDAIRDGCVDEAKQMIVADSACLEERSDKGSTPLMFAAASGHLEIVEVLLARGVSIDEKNEKGMLALFYAVLSGHPDIVRLLSGPRTGTLVNETVMNGWTPLMMAVDKGFGDVVHVLIELGARVSEPDVTGKTALHFAVDNGHVDILKILLESGAFIDEIDHSGNTGLFYAAASGHVDTVKLLLREVAAIHKKNNSGLTALFAAAHSGNAAITQLLLESGASLNDRNQAGETALILPVSEGHTDVVRLLLSHGADANELNHAGAPPLFYAALDGHAAIVQELLNKGADVDKAEVGGLLTPLMCAASKGHFEIMRILLKQGASTEIADESGWTALFHATANGHGDAVVILLESGALLDVRDMDGKSPIDCTHRNIQDFIAYLLAGNGVLVEGTKTFSSAVEMSSPTSIQKAVSPTSVLHQAARSGDASSVKAYIVRGGWLDNMDTNGHTPIFLVSKNGHAAVVKLLLDGGADILHSDSEDCDPLLEAGRAGHVKIVELLVEAGASINCCGDDGETPLISAARWDFVGGVRLLIESGGSLGRLDNVTEAKEHEKPLIPETLNFMEELCGRLNEVEDMGMRIVKRLVTICDRLQQQQEETDQIGEDILVRFATIIFRACQLLLRCEIQGPVARLIGNRARTMQMAEMHEAIDHFVLFNMSDESLPPSNWRDQLKNIPALQTLSFQALYQDETLLRNELADEDTLELLRYELVKHSDKYDEEELLAIKGIIPRLVVLSRNDASAVPGWFIARDDIEFHGWNQVGVVDSSSTAKRFNGTWMKTRVMIIATEDLSKDEFEERALRWHQLSHPHVTELYGACHVGEPFIFVAEFSSIGTIRSFLRSADNSQLLLWQKLHEAALGLQYLHERSIVHGELRCENIFIGNDLAAKVSGFGESSLAGVKNSSVAVRWKARELLEGQRATFTSDIYALGMCILEAVTDAAPWVNQANFDTHVMRYVRLGIIPRRPRTMSDSQWALVQAMCASDDHKRVKVGYVVNALEKLAREECALQHTQKQRSCAFCSSGNHYSMAKGGDARSDNDCGEVRKALCREIMQKLYTDMSFLVCCILPGRFSSDDRDLLHCDH